MTVAITEAMSRSVDRDEPIRANISVLPYIQMRIITPANARIRFINCMNNSSFDKLLQKQHLLFSREMLPMFLLYPK